MPTTSAGNIYQTQFAGAPFAFLAVMYPRNKRFTDFGVRPSILAPLNEPLSVEGVDDFCNQTLSHDLQAGKKEYFKYIKKHWR